MNYNYTIMNQIKQNCIGNNYNSNQINSNLEKFMRTYYHTFDPKQTKFYIVCHSAIMKKLVNDKTRNVINNTKKSIKNIYDNDNVWELTIGNFHFFRHAYSVANMHKDKSSFSISGLKHKLLNQNKEKDAKLSLFGILSTLRLSSLKKINIDNDVNILVSPLIRTWMTALCLFLPKLIHNETIKLTLQVGKHLKEEGSTPDNQPESKTIQLRNIKYFLYFLTETLPYVLGSSNNFPNFKNKNYEISIKFSDQCVNEIKFNTRNNNSNLKKLINMNVPKNYESVHKNLGNNFNQARKKYYQNINNIVQNIIKEYKNKTNNEKKIYIDSNIKNNNLIIEHGIKKPKKNINKFSKWYEPFSIKSGNNTSGLKLSARFLPSFGPKRKTFYNAKLPNQENNENNENIQYGARKNKSKTKENKK